MPKLHLWPEEFVEEEDQFTVSATLDHSGGERKLIWYRLPGMHKPALTKSCDPFVLGALFTAMRTGKDLVVHGTASPSLLRNLEEYQGVWNNWKPDCYSKVDIFADREEEQPKPETTAAIVTFSGGVDSSFTVYRHHRLDLGRSRQDLRAGLFIHGFDIPFSKKDSYERAAEKANIMLESLGMGMIPMAMNLKQLGDDWDDSHSAVQASCMSLMQGGFVSGLIASSYPYSNLQLPWGGNPVSDWLLSSDSFTILHDGAGYSRYEKICALKDWPEALQYLRVCIRGEQRDKNCSRCDKCVRCIIYFRMAGAGLPPAFEKDVTDLHIAATKYPSEGKISIYRIVVSDAKAAGISESWVHALELSIFFNILRMMIIKSSIYKYFKRLFIRQ